MTKQTFKKILSGGVLSSKEVSAEDKKVIYDTMKQYGMSESTAYLRFFDKGFRQWELLGVTKLRQEFLLTTPTYKQNGENDSEVVEEDGTRGYGYVISLEEGYDDSKFYDLVTNLKMGYRLCEFMAERGMSSATTTRTRFKANDWKPWELMGINAIVDILTA